MTNVAFSNWSAIEAEYAQIDLLNCSIRRVLNLVYAWLRRVCPEDHWNTHFADAFKFDPATQRKMDERRNLTRPATGRDKRATIQIRRRDRPAPAASSDAIT